MRTGRGLLLIDGRAIACALGPAGIRRDKREGDGGTPAGRYRLLGGFVRDGTWRGVARRLSLRRTRADDGWCDDVGHAAYNRRVTLPCAASHERLLRDDAVYDIVLVLDHNQRPRVRGRGSAIFIHLARPGFTPTAGCIALGAADMRRLAGRLGPKTRIDIG